ncbi:conserved hypothetical protein, partial [Ricinus communis]
MMRLSVASTASSTAPTTPLAHEQRLGRALECHVGATHIPGHAQRDHGQRRQRGQQGRGPAPGRDQAHGLGVAQVQPPAQMQAAQEAADGKHGQDGRVHGNAHAGLVQRAAAAAVRDLHAQAEDEGAHQQADAGRAQGGREFGIVAQQRHGQRGGQRQQQQLAEDAAGVLVLDQHAPARGEAEALAGQHPAQAQAHGEQRRLAHRDAPQQPAKENGQDGRKRKSFHMIFLHAVALPREAGREAPCHGGKARKRLRGCLLELFFPPLLGVVGQGFGAAGLVGHGRRICLLRPVHHGARIQLDARQARDFGQAEPVGGRPVAGVAEGHHVLALLALDLGRDLLGRGGIDKGGGAGHEPLV